MTARQLFLGAALHLASVTVASDAFATDPPADCEHQFSESPTQEQYYGLAEGLAYNECTSYCYPDEWHSTWYGGDVCGWEVIDLFLFEHPVLEQLVYILIEEVVDIIYPYL
jgi:hypothetical protein